MRLKKDWYKSDRARLLFAIGLNLAFLLVLLLCFEVRFEENDDLTVQKFLDGQTAIKTPFVVYINYFLAKLLIFLYDISGNALPVFGLFQYVLLLSMIQLLFTVLKSKKAGIIAALVLNFAGFVLTPDRFMTWLNLPTEMRYYANLLSAWLSPLQHATYTMHNFGYDLLPRLHVSYLILGGATVAMIALSMLKMRTFQFSFTGGYSDE